MYRPHIHPDTIFGLHLLWEHSVHFPRGYPKWSVTPSPTLKPCYFPGRAFYLFPENIGGEHLRAPVTSRACTDIAICVPTRTI